MISNTLSSIITNLSNAYDALGSKGATIPLSKNFENLASTIQTVKSNSAPSLLDRTITKYIDTDGLETIPSYAFANCGSLSEISFPECIHIRQYAFNSCVSLTSVSFPKCITLSSYVFYNCTYLSNINLPNVSEILDINVFGRCSELQEVNLPKLSRIVGSSVFNGCINLRELSLPNLRIMSGALIFDGCNRLANLSLPNLSTLAGASHFRGCSQLLTIDLPNCITLSGANSGAFGNATGLLDISLPLLTSIYGSGTFESATNLRSVSIPYLDNISGARTFGGCTNLEEAFLPALSYISSVNAFRNCINLRSVFCCLGLIHSNTFSGTYGINLYILSAGSPITIMTPGFPTNTRIYVPSEVVYAYHAAYPSYNIDAIENSPDVSRVDKYHIIYCGYLAGSTITSADMSNMSNVEYILHYGFDLSPFEDMSYISFPNCRYIGIGAFRGIYGYDTSLGEPIHPTLDFINCKLIAQEAFSNANINSINLPNCKRICDSAFSQCYLRNITIPECIYLGSSAFIDAVYLQSISLPNISYIGESCFYNCNSLSQVIIATSRSYIIPLGTTTIFDSTPMRNSTYLGYYGSIYVPDSLVSQYKEATNWVTYADRITGISNLPSA